MKKRKNLTIILFLSMLLSSLSLMVACHDKNTEEELNLSKSTTEKERLREIFNSGEVADFTTEEFSSYIREVSDCYAIDLISLAKQKFFNCFDTLKLRLCLLQQIEQKNISAQKINQIHNIISALNVAMADNDSVATKRLCLEFYNLANCSNESSFDRLEWDISNPIVDMSNIASRNLTYIKDFCSELNRYDETDLEFIIGICAYTHILYNNENNHYKVAPTKCSTCKNRMNVAMTKTIGEYMVNSALCLKFINPWVYAGCLAFCSAVLISDVYEINESYKDCLANCVN